jgi:molybdopterin/thiamine biosynthesis adenylyltransferase
MSRADRSVAMTTDFDQAARAHLLREDRQEDLCFALWRRSIGRTRTTALIVRLILPREGERNVHGNASFEPAFLERAMSEAAAIGGGLALLHSHPLGRGWQGMSADDIAAEQGNAGAVLGATGLPFLGLTLARDGAWSARFWERIAPRAYERNGCATVRVAGDRLGVSYMDELAPAPSSSEEQIRTVSAWGEESQRNLVRLRVGVIGAGSVGGMIAEALARMGFEDVLLMDFDIIKKHNLDRLNYATREDVGRKKIEVLAGYLRARATASHFRADTVDAAVYEENGYRAALDCDLLFSCVDRPWGRYILNLIAYTHLIPVIDGGIRARSNRFGKIAAADWRAHTATSGRPCLQCLRQYDPGHLQLERDGLLDDPTYIEGLPSDHPLKARQNVFAFSMSCASMQVLQMLALVIAPLGLSNPGSQMYHFVGSFMEEPQFGQCDPACLFPRLTALGESANIHATGERPQIPEAAIPIIGL